MVPEDQEKGAVSWATCRIFVKEIGGLFSLLFLVGFGLTEGGFSMLSNMLLSKWSTEFRSVDKDSNLMKYLFYCLIVSSSATVRTIGMTFVGYFLSRNINARMMSPETSWWLTCDPSSSLTTSSTR
jgi:hypothetical protein